MKNQEKLFWTTLSFFGAMSIFCLLFNVSGHLSNFLLTYVPLLLVFIHSFWTLTYKRGVFFIALASILPFAAEAFSLNHGTLFGGNYTYSGGASLLKVPLAVISYWVIFVYLGYWLVTTFLYWSRRDKPNHKKSPLYILFGLVLLDGLAVTAIDLVMDPVQVKSGAWTWMEGGDYFGVPLGNFLGWFLVTIFVTGVFRTHEYYRPIGKVKIRDSIYLMPVYGYLMVGLFFVLGAIKYHLDSLAIIGLLILVLPAILNIFAFLKYKKT